MFPFSGYHSGLNPKPLFRQSAGRRSRNNPKYQVPVNFALDQPYFIKKHKHLFRKLLSSAMCSPSWSSSSSSSTARSEKGSSSTNGGPHGKQISLPVFVYHLNASTKWIVFVCNTVALFSRPQCYEGPLVVFGAISAFYFTNVLKKIINQGRPDDAPFTDPGMPSSHSLISFFTAASWWWSTSLYGSVVVANNAAAAVGDAMIIAPTTTTITFGLIWRGTALWGGAFIVSLLRVVCGYHTWAQIGVGAVLGTFLGTIWMWMGNGIYVLHPTSTFYVLWGLYLSGTAFFISRTMKNWFTFEKHL